MKQWNIKPFSQLTTYELYRLLQARSAVFVVEQNCPYQDLDDLDQACIHLWLEDSGQILALCRIFWEDQTVHIGRVLSTVRGQGLGREVMEKALEYCTGRYPYKAVLIEAQAYAVPFYEKLGFSVISDEFLLDNIPHVEMRWDSGRETC